MAQGISAVLTFAVGVAISPVPIIAVTLTLFSQRARVNGSMFLLGWVLAVAVVSGVAYTLGDQGDAATSSTAADTIAWGKIVFGVLLLLLAGLLELLGLDQNDDGVGDDAIARLSLRRLRCL